MVGIRALQKRVDRLGRKRESPFERRLPWQEFHDMMITAASDGSMDPEDAADLYFGVKHWYDSPECWL